MHQIALQTKLKIGRTKAKIFMQLSKVLMERRVHLIVKFEMEQQGKKCKKVFDPFEYIR